MCTMPMASGTTGAVQLWATLAVECGDRNHGSGRVAMSGVLSRSRRHLLPEGGLVVASASVDGLDRRARGETQVRKPTAAARPTRTSTDALGTRGLSAPVSAAMTDTPASRRHTRPPPDDGERTGEVEHRQCLTRSRKPSLIKGYAHLWWRPVSPDVAPCQLSCDRPGTIQRDDLEPGELGSLPGSATTRDSVRGLPCGA